MEIFDFSAMLEENQWLPQESFDAVPFGDFFPLSEELFDEKRGVQEEDRIDVPSLKTEVFPTFLPQEEKMPTQFFWIEERGATEIYVENDMTTEVFSSVKNAEESLRDDAPQVWENIAVPHQGNSSVFTAITALSPGEAVPFGESLFQETVVSPFRLGAEEYSSDLTDGGNAKGEVHIHNEIPAIHIEFSGNLESDVDVDKLMREMQKRLQEEISSGTDFSYHC